MSSEQFRGLYRPGDTLRKTVGMFGPLLRRVAQTASVNKYDLLLVQREAMIFGPAFFEWLYSTVGSLPVVLDLDDATYSRYVSPTYGRAGSWLKFFGKTDGLIDRSETIVCGNPFIAQYVRSRAKMRLKLDVEDRYVMVYVGSFGGWYLTEEMLELFAVAREFNPKTFALILTQRDKEKVIEKIRAKGFGDREYLVESVSAGEIPGYLNASDSAVSFIKACYSKQSSSPTKIAEYLACGLPIVSNRGVGDVDKLIEGNKVGVIVDDFSRDSYLKALSRIKELGDVGDKCRQTARREFDLENVGGERYRLLYNKILGKENDGQDR